MTKVVIITNCLPLVLSSLKPISITKYSNLETDDHDCNVFQKVKSLKISLMETAFSLKFLCGNTVCSRSTTPLVWYYLCVIAFKDKLEVA